MGVKEIAIISLICANHRGIQIILQKFQEKNSFFLKIDQEQKFDYLTEIKFFSYSSGHPGIKVENPLKHVKRGRRLVSKCVSSILWNLY